MPNYQFLKGTGVALITPFDIDGSVDYHGLAQVINHCIEGGVNYLVSMGTTGESVTLTSAEKKSIIKYTVDQINGRVPLVIGIGGNNTAELLEEIRNQDFTGIAAILSSSPAYNKPSQEGIYQHYMALEAVSPLPIIIYNVPGRTASNISPETTIRLANASSKFAAIKEASGDLVQATKILKERPDHFLVISGDDPLALGLMGIGGDGVISVIANVYPRAFSKIISCASANEWHKAQFLNLALSDIHKWLYIEGNPVGVKAAAMELGLCGHYVRLPLIALSDANRRKLHEEMIRLKELI